MAVTPEEVASRILALATESPSNTISGGSLAGLLKHHFPGFTLGAYGAKNLRAFIHDHLSGRLNELGKVGTDIVYGLPGATPPPQAAPITPAGQITQEVMRVFKSPNAPLELHANRETGEIRVIARNTAPQEPWTRIRPVSAEALLQIVKDFVADLPVDYHVDLMLILKEVPWWPKFSGYLQEKNLYNRWLAFKSKQVRAKLESELRGLGVRQLEAPTTPLAEEEKPAAATPLPHPAPSEASRTQPFVRDELREAVVRVVQGLPIAEIRNLKLPVGDVYDALIRRR